MVGRARRQVREEKPVSEAYSEHTAERFVNFDFRADGMKVWDWKKIAKTAFAMQEPIQYVLYRDMDTSGSTFKVPKVTVRRVTVREKDAAWFKVCWSDRLFGHSEPMMPIDLVHDPVRTG